MTAICALCLSVVSRNNEVSDPRFALALNPLNSEAAVNLVVGELNGSLAPDLQSLADIAARLISIAPADARAYSILGAVEARRGDRPGSEALYELALGRSKSELHALLSLAQARLDGSDTAGALDYIDLLLRRWPSYWDSVRPILVAAASDPAAAGILESKLNETPPWRSRAIALLAQDQASIGMLRKLIVAAPDEIRKTTAWLAERDTVVAALVRVEAYADAYALFLSTLSAEEARVSAYVFDGGFEMPIGRSYFGWRVQKPGATEVTTGGMSGSGAAGLRVRFLDSPARPAIVSQNIVLPFGRYKLAMQASAGGLHAPKSLFWSVTCGKGPTLATLEVPPGSYSGKELEMELDVPPSNCQRQVLSLDTGVRTESWRDRYRGEVRFASLAITRL